MTVSELWRPCKAKQKRHILSLWNKRLSARVLFTNCVVTAPREIIIMIIMRRQAAKSLQMTSSFHRMSHYLAIVFWVGGGRCSESESTMTEATTGSRTIPGWWWVLINRWNEWQGKPKYSEKTCLSAALNWNPWPESATELYRPRDSHLSAKLVPNFADIGKPRG
jgi:hypothetical protein